MTEMKTIQKMCLEELTADIVSMEIVATEFEYEMQGLRLSKTTTTENSNQAMGQHQLRLQKRFAMPITTAERLFLKRMPLTK
ncbi:hypothetical protein SAMN04488542_12413 [Fontibacillus panacisegetis]|uniref:Uncharacterized protein n=1 Tax=Fontibacillus panacisegetis TaxID=670482 RepID=A0A1G7R0E3_9BACL|nr:hypothetical protein [Fontibacillus panacisegetis]SDG03410.1 hypothetical protein SAMN04488542_12413 [Fontibacillus panacisegetis]